MQFERIGKRGHLFIFELGDVGTDTANVYVIKGKTHWFVIDTFLGPEAIFEIKSVLNTDFTEKPTIVVNTHAHFDHFWGNCAFPHATIIAHTLCRQAINTKQQVEYLEKNAKFQQGKVELVAPNLTFENRLVFEDEGVVKTGQLHKAPGLFKILLALTGKTDNNIGGQ